MNKEVREIIKAIDPLGIVGDIRRTEQEILRERRRVIGPGIAFILLVPNLPVVFPQIKQMTHPQKDPQVQSHQIRPENQPNIMPEYYVDGTKICYPKPFDK